MYVDSHCHLNMLDLEPFAGELEKVLSNARLKGVHYFLCVAVTLEDHTELRTIAEKHKNVFISAGVHPNEKPGEIIDGTQLDTIVQHPKVIAIGETGLDYFRSEGDVNWQRERFRQHIDCAKKYKKPLIIHTRAAKEDTLEILKNENAGQVGGVMHCFTEDWETAKKALDLGFYISFSGIVTFKNATILQDVARKVPIDRMLIETDSPYLAPVPYRGKSNLPEYVCYVAEYIATLRKESSEKVGEWTTKNFFTLFKHASR